MKKRPLSVLVALDDSREARSAVVATLAFPWPASASVSGVVARRTPAARGRPEYVRQALDHALRRAATSAEQALRHRWAAAHVAVVDRAPTEAILARARRAHADVIVLGSRRRGWAARMILGSVSRTVVQHAPCTTMVVRGRPHGFSRILVGIDGSPNSVRAVDFVKRLSRARGGEVHLVAMVEPIAPPSIPLAPRSVRAELRRMATHFSQPAHQQAQRQLRVHERALRRAGWKARSRVVSARPLEGLLAAVADTRADVLVVGARGGGGIERLLLGSVAEGVLDRCPVSVVVVR